VGTAGNNAVAGGRIAGYDLARGLAVIGMIVVNFVVVMGGDDGGPAWLRALVGLLEGKAAATFVVLAGVGISLLSRVARATENRKIQWQARGLLLRRAAFLFIVGLAYLPVWPGDILHFYGAYLLVAAVTLRWSDRGLWTGVFTANVVFIVLLLSLDYERGWDWSTLEYLDLWTGAGMARHLLFNGFHPVFPWVGFLLAGMWLGRQDLRDATMRRAVLSMGALLLIGGSLTAMALAGLLVADPEISIEVANALAGTGPMPPTPIYFTVGLGAAFTVIAAAVSMERHLQGQAWVTALCDTGRLSLTVYVAHVVIGMGALEMAGRLSGQTLTFAVTAAIGFSLLSIAFATVWLRRFEHGPLETLMRAVTG
jgi:uncharacterized membrane protein YeiB